MAAPWSFTCGEHVGHVLRCARYPPQEHQLNSIASPLPPTQPVPWRAIDALAAAKLMLHLTVLMLTPYGVHRDEFLYLSMGRHLRFWRMDFPPLIAMLVSGVFRAP